MPTPNNNPYSPPSQLLDPNSLRIPSILFPIHAQYHFTPQHFAQTLSRFRSQSLLHSAWRTIRIPTSLLFLLATGFSLWAGFSTNQIGPMLPISAFLFLLAPLSLMTGSLGNYFALNSLRHDPTVGKKFHLTIDQQGIHIASHDHIELHPWSTIRHARSFRDGVLFLTHPHHLMIWIPDASLDVGNHRPLLHDITKHLSQLRSLTPLQNP